jgi:hypothetical protein
MTTVKFINTVYYMIKVNGFGYFGVCRSELYKGGYKYGRI